jgi:predicted amidohydrolase
MTLRIAQIRIVPEKGDLAGNFAALRLALEAVEKHRPDVVVTPECFLDGYVSTEKSVTRKNIGRFAIDPGSSVYAREIAGWAARRRSWFIFGCTRQTPAGVFNSALIFNRRGDIAGAYDKVHCQNSDRKYAPGNALPVFDSDFGKFGVVICADRRWPETVRALALQRARVVFNPTYGMSCDLNLAMMRTRSFESEVVIAFTHPSQSLITGPSGEVLVDDRRRGRRFTVTGVDLAEVDKVRRSPSAHLKDRRPEIYHAEKGGR